MVFGSSLDTWEPWAQTLSARYRVIRFDLPGFGLTGADPTGDYTDAREMRILMGLMDQLGIDRANLAGNSLGGRIAWTFAAQHPDRVIRLVLISPDGFASPGFEYGKPPKVPLMMQALPYVAPRGLLKANLAVAYAHPHALSEATLTRYRDLMLAPGVRLAILARMSQVVLQDPIPILSRIQAPTPHPLGRKGWHDPNLQRCRLSARSAPRDFRSPTPTWPRALRGRPCGLLAPGGVFSVRQDALEGCMAARC